MFDLFRRADLEQRADRMSLKSFFKLPFREANRGGAF